MPSSIRLFPFACLLEPLSFCTKPNPCKPLRNREREKAKGKSQQRAANARVGGMTAASRCRTRSGAPSAISSSAIECCPSRRHSAFGRPDEERRLYPFSFLLSHRFCARKAKQNSSKGARRAPPVRGVLPFARQKFRSRPFSFLLFPFAFFFRFGLRYTRL